MCMILYIILCMNIYIYIYINIYIYIYIYLCTPYRLFPIGYFDGGCQHRRNSGSPAPPQLRSHWQLDGLGILRHG